MWHVCEPGRNDLCDEVCTTEDQEGTTQEYTSKAGYPKVELSPDRAARPLIKLFLHSEMDQINTVKINNILF